jgi:hypothetical protein
MAQVMAWRAQAKGNAAPAKLRATRGTGNWAQQKAWHCTMRNGPGIFIAMRIVSEANQRNRWEQIRRKKAQSEAVALHLMTVPKPALPCVVKMTIYTRKMFDDDNRVNSCKAVRDTIAKWLGVDDKTDGMFVVKQELAPAGCWGLRIECDDNPRVF